MCRTGVIVTAAGVVWITVLLQRNWQGLPQDRREIQPAGLFQEHYK